MLLERLKQLPFFYGWVVLGLSFLGLFATFGIRASFGAYVIPWEQEFATSRTTVTFISTLSLITYAAFQPIAGKLSDRYGTRLILAVSLFLAGTALVLASVANQLWQLVLLYGIVASIGLAGASNVTASAIVAHWFVEKRGLAMGLVLSGMAVGQLVVTPVSLYLIANYDWRLSMFVISLIILIILPVCYMFVRSKPEDIGLRPYGEKDEAVAEQASSSSVGKINSDSIFAVMKERAFWLLTIPYFICGFTDVGLIGTHFIPFAEEKDFPIIIIGTVMAIIASFNIVGTIGTGYLSDRLNRSKLLATIYWIRGVMFILVITAESPAALYVFAVLYGATEMASIAPTSSLCAHLFKQYSIGAVFGFVSVSHQLGAAVGSLVPGVLYDLTGSYSIVFIMSIILLWGSGLLVRLVPDTPKISGESMAVRNTLSKKV
ncbi:MAG: MFS transporter [Desulfotomaculaceae bacterium]